MDSKYQFWELCNALGDFGHVSQLEQIVHVKNVGDAVPEIARHDTRATNLEAFKTALPFKLPDQALDSVDRRIGPPLGHDVFHGHRVEHYCRHDSEKRRRG